jgi:hypothetical protein
MIERNSPKADEDIRSCDFLKQKDETKWDRKLH